MIIYRFQVIQISMDPSLSIFMLLERFGVSSPPYIESKWKRNPLPFDENIITDKSQHKKNSEISKSTLFFHSKPMEESVILNIQYTG